MAIFKCKMCGGDLEIGSNETVAVCEYCNTKQTIPALDNEKKINLFNRANRLRFNNEFDKAAGVYESIAAEFPEEAEAYWGLCLCKYGIEYIDDPKTGNKVPTCHRTSFDEIFSDNNFGLALEYADFTATSVYREEAKEIDRLQKAILDIAKNEEPFDIFICYKETAEDGQRTKDSVLAQDMYDKLTEKGYKVFFSRITLEDKLGKEYEPYIFSALNSAKVMLAVGTKYEYYNAVWVKNEWSRFLDMMKSDKEKVLIPCYADIDAYDMPQEFKNLQGQDMGKIGFMQDLLRGIGKILGENAPQQTIIRETVVSLGSADTAPLLKRAFMFLEDGDFKSAEEYCEKVLDMNPECAEAYLGKLMVALKLRKESDFELIKTGISGMDNYKKVMRFGDDALKTRLQEYNDRFLYNQGIDYMNEGQYTWAMNKFEEVGFDYKDSQAKYEEAKLGFYNQSIDLMNSGKFLEAMWRFEEIGFDYKDSQAKYDEAKKCYFNKMNKTAVSEGFNHLVGLKSDGTVIVKSYNINDEEFSRRSNEEGECNVKSWKDIISVSASINHTVGLKSDGTVVAVGKNDYGQCDVSGWRNIVAVSAGYRYTVGLKSDGTVVAVGRNDYGQCDVSGWKDIVAIATGDSHTIGLKSDGTVVATEDDDYGQCDVSDWTDIIAISVNSDYLVGLKSDGTVVATEDDDYGQCDVSDWTDIVAVSAGLYHTLGLKSDGTVVSNDEYDDMSAWTDIVAIYGGSYGLKSDGTVVAYHSSDNDNYNVSSLTDIKVY